MLMPKDYIEDKKDEKFILIIIIVFTLIVLSCWISDLIRLIKAFFS